MSERDRRTLELLWDNQIYISGARCVNCGEAKHLSYHLIVTDPGHPIFKAYCKNAMLCAERCEEREAS